MPVKLAMNNTDNQPDNREQETDQPQRFLIVGLGNPGRRYRHNRHNIGFMVVDRLADELGIHLNRVQLKAITGDGRYGQHTLILAKPQTFMNLSGDAIGPLVRYYRIPVENVLVIYDDLDLPLGSLRLRGKGGAGGHKGMKSIIQHLGEAFPRLRLGINRPPGQLSSAAFVLQDFGKNEASIVVDVIEEAVRAVASFVQSGVDLAMSRHNKNLMAEE